MQSDSLSFLTATVLIELGLWSPLSYIRSKYPNPKSVLELVGAGIAAYCGDLGSKGIARQGFRAIVPFVS